MKIRIGAAYAAGSENLFDSEQFTGDGALEMTIFCYRDWDELERTVEAMRLHLDGLLLDSDLAMRFLVQRGSLKNLSCEAVEPSDGDLLRMLIGRMSLRNDWDLSRVLMDVGSCGNALDSLLPIGRRPVVISRDVWGGYDLHTWENIILQRYQDAWGSGCFDLIVTRRTKVLNRLSVLGIQAWGIAPSKRTAGSCVCALLNKIRARMLGELLPVCAVVGTFGGPSAIELLGETLNSFNDEYNKGIPIFRRSGVFELEVSNRDLIKITSGYRACALMEYLRQNLRETASVGWGIGLTMAQARTYAIRAYRESMFDRSGYSYLVDDEGRMIGPLSGDTAESKLSDARLRRQRELALCSGLTLTSVQKLFTALEGIKSQTMTSGDLAQGLGITRRSAARILARLEQCGLAEQESPGEPSPRGRPAKKYLVRL